MKTFRADRVSRTWTQQIGAPPEVVFPLLCPVREYDWIPTWKCELLYSDSGVIECDCIFRTEAPGGGRQVWVVTERDPEAHKLGFVVVRGEDLVLRHDVSLRGDGETTAVRWESTFTGLSPEGNRQVQAVTDEAYGKRLAILGQLLDHYCRTGEMLGAASHPSS